MFVNKTLISILLTLIVLIIMKSSNKFKIEFYKQVYNNNISFALFNDIYNKYIGSLRVFDDVYKAETVFSEKLIYTDKEQYYDGVALKVSSNYLVPANKSGVVVYIGPKDNYGNTVIVQRIDGIDEWYGNISNVNVKLYDYVKEKTLIGEADKILYLVYKKNGNVVNYEEILE